MEIKELENLLLNFIKEVTSREKAPLSKKGYSIYSELKQSENDIFYESEINIRLYKNKQFIDIHIIEIVFINKNESFVFMDKESLPELEKEVIYKLQEWDKMYQ